MRPRLLDLYCGQGGASSERPVTRHAMEAMGIDWMTWKGLAQAIPPAYTEWIGERLLAHLGANA